VNDERRVGAAPETESKCGITKTFDACKATS
jgi:hypothetical protein